MITLSCRLEFKTAKEVLELLRNFSSCIRYAYNRLLEGMDRKELKKHLQKIFPLNSRYCDDAIMK
ncbi:MAG: transposase, partial [Deltaproteobacteria bacterium]|nr:transposase [Deltaproteobacteria bacterium]